MIKAAEVAEMNILLIGSGAREHAIASKLKENKNTKLFCFATNNNPGILALVEDIIIGDVLDVLAIINYAKKIKAELAWVGPEAPLAVGVVDALAKINVPSVGPTKQLADLEISKTFTRDLLQEYQINASPIFETELNIQGVADFSARVNHQTVIKPDGLTGGKGVLVFGDHYHSQEEELKFAKDYLEKDGKVLMEEKLIGQEFSLMSFCDGEHLAHMPMVQDHKRAFIDDKGPNTGGMGSYACADFSLPFLSKQDVEEAKKINEQTLVALKNKFGIGYKGIMYGGFIATKNGVKLIEYNARFGDPEAMNVLLTLKTDLTEISEAIVNGTLDKTKVEFEPLATVCKYVVPEGYPAKSVKNVAVDISAVDQNKVKLFYASIDEKEGKLFLKGSRAIGVVAKANTLEEAEKIVQTEIVKIKGPVFYREDIGTKALVEKRVKMMKEIRK